MIAPNRPHVGAHPVNAMPGSLLDLHKPCGEQPLEVPADLGHGNAEALGQG